MLESLEMVTVPSHCLQPVVSLNESPLYPDRPERNRFYDAAHYTRERDRRSYTTRIGGASLGAGGNGAHEPRYSLFSHKEAARGAVAALTNSPMRFAPNKD